MAIPLAGDHARALPGIRDRWGERKPRPRAGAHGLAMPLVEGLDRVANLRRCGVAAWDASAGRPGVVAPPPTRGPGGVLPLEEALAIPLVNHHVEMRGKPAPGLVARRLGIAERLD